jgi:hypothetical protein
MVGSSETIVISLDSEMKGVSDTLGEENKLSIDKSHDKERLTAIAGDDVNDSMSRTDAR